MKAAVIFTDRLILLQCKREREKSAEDDANTEDSQDHPLVNEIEIDVNPTARKRKIAADREIHDWRQEVGEREKYETPISEVSDIARLMVRLVE
jgi:hypothetical protein